MSAADRFREVTEVEFDAFLAAYPRKLERDVNMTCDPPFVTYNDFTMAPAWPESVVASYIHDDWDPKAPVRRGFRILK